MKQDIYWPIQKLQSQGLIKFKSNTPENIMRNLREVEIFIDSFQRLNMMIKSPPKLYPKTVATNSVEQQLIFSCPLTLIFSYVDEINFEQIKFYKRRNQEVKQNKTLLLSMEKSLIYTISKINLPKLQELNLRNCQIQSLQSLSFLNLKNLKKLFLANNNLVTLNSLSKLHTPKLYWLQLSILLLLFIQGFNRILMAKRIALIEVSEKENNANKDAFTYLSNWIFKLPFDHINYIRKNQKYLDFNKISQKKALQKYPDLSFR